MCGVASIFAYKPAAARVDPTELDQFNVSMGKRGPDGSGVWHRADGSIGLAHTRLSVIDLSERAAQPMATTDRKTIISFNGEIYNYQELRKDLAQKGYTFRANSDTEVLLYLYQEYGQDMLSRLRGMFAFVIWDDEASTLFCARDPYGIKPLYFNDDGSTLRVASQVRTLLGSNIDSREQDPAGLVGFYLFGHIPEPFTLFRSIRALPAGCTMTLTAGRKPFIERYTRICEIFHGASAREFSEKDDNEFLEQALTDSIRYHTVADVPIGLFLSAGIDSSLLLALLARAGHEQITAVTVSFDEYQNSDDDEAPMAARVASAHGARHETVRLTEPEIRSVVPAFMQAMDQPSIDGLNTWLISRAVAQRGLKVALSGTGGDEMFGGYPSFRDLPRWQSLFSRTHKIPGLNPVLSTALKCVLNFGLPINPKLISLPRLGDSWPGAYLARRGLFMPWELGEILGRDLAEAGLEALRPVELIGSELEPDPGNAFVRTATLESSLYLKNQLLRDTDWASMDHSLEVRTPLVDHTLLRTLAPVLKSAGGKINKNFLAETIGAGMPAGWATRSKTGFTVPIHQWLESVSDLDVWRRIPALRSRNCHWARRWAYTVMSTVHGAHA